MKTNNLDRPPVIFEAEEQPEQPEGACSELVGNTTFVFNLDFNPRALIAAIEDLRDAQILHERENEESESAEAVLAGLGL